MRVSRQSLARGARSAARRAAVAPSLTFGWWGSGGRGGRGGTWCTVGAEVLAASGGITGCGGYYYEVEVLEAEGGLRVGFAGTNFSPQCLTVGDDACSWSFLMNNGNGWHGGGRGRE
jgi:hypothetical protein